MDIIQSTERHKARTKLSIRKQRDFNFEKEFHPKPISRQRDFFFTKKASQSTVDILDSWLKRQKSLYK